MHAGKGRGVLYHLGSGGGKRQYKNPHTRGVVVASMSSVMPSAQAVGAAPPGAGGAPITAPRGAPERFVEHTFSPSVGAVMGAGSLASGAAAVGFAQMAAAAMQASLFGGARPPALAATPALAGAVHNQTDDRPASWMAVDLGEGMALYPERYCLRTDSDGNLAPSHWQLQGSSDGVVWVVLRRHVDEKWKGASGFVPFAAPPNPTPAGNAAPALAEASWKLEHALVQGRGFRHFRIVQTGPNLGGTNVLACAGIELYGVLETAPKPPETAPKAAAALRARLRTAEHAGPQAFTELLQHLRSRVQVLSEPP